LKVPGVSYSLLLQDEEVIAGEMTTRTIERVLGAH
jgi:hypothetical protein